MDLDLDLAGDGLVTSLHLAQCAHRGRHLCAWTSNGIARIVLLWTRLLAGIVLGISIR